MVDVELVRGEFLLGTDEKLVDTVHVCSPGSKHRFDIAVSEALSSLLKIDQSCPNFRFLLHDDLKIFSISQFMANLSDLVPGGLTAFCNGSIEIFLELLNEFLTATKNVRDVLERWLNIGNKVKLVLVIQVSVINKHGGLLDNLIKGSKVDDMVRDVGKHLCHAGVELGSFL